MSNQTQTPKFNLETAVSTIPSREALQRALELTDKLEEARTSVNILEVELQGILSGETPEIPVSAPVAAAGRRGKTKSQVYDALKKAGKKGISIDDLAKLLKTNKANISAWFSITGKKDSRIHRIAPGVYCLENHAVAA